MVAEPHEILGGSGSQSPPLPPVPSAVCRTIDSDHQRTQGQTEKEPQRLGTWGGGQSQGAAAGLESPGGGACGGARRGARLPGSPFRKTVHPS